MPSCRRCSREQANSSRRRHVGGQRDRGPPCTRARAGWQFVALEVLADPYGAPGAAWAHQRGGLARSAIIGAARDVMDDHAL